MSSSTDSRSRVALLRLARHAIATSVGGTYAVPFDATLPILDERRGAFVTLHQRARLRGCIGRVQPDDVLRALIPDVARSAALSDPRFPAVRPDELESLVIEISLLSVPASIREASEVDVGRHGLFILARGRRGLLLPQVATQYRWTREEFLAEVCAKAGLPPDAWRAEGVRLQTFTADVFSEEDES
jgi:AmmeMemoRadiSam system protein A